MNDNGNGKIFPPAQLDRFIDLYSREKTKRYIVEQDILYSSIPDETTRRYKDIDLRGNYLTVERVYHPLKIFFNSQTPYNFKLVDRPCVINIPFSKIYVQLYNDSKGHSPVADTEMVLKLTAGLGFYSGLLDNGYETQLFSGVVGASSWLYTSDFYVKPYVYKTLIAWGDNANLQYTFRVHKNYQISPFAAYDFDLTALQNLVVAGGFPIPPSGTPITYDSFTDPVEYVRIGFLNNDASPHNVRYMLITRDVRNV